MSKTILVVGTYDTKSDELQYISDKILERGGLVLTMDVSVLGESDVKCDISKRDIALAIDKTIDEVIDSGDENSAMQLMASGASSLASSLYANNKFDGVIVLGGTMGTDLALDVCQALPVGVPKYIVSTVAFSPLIPPDRLSPDIQMILWAGGLYGLNSICKLSLSQAAGAVLGATESVEFEKTDRPLIGMTSLGASCLSYMKKLKPALEARGFEVAIFHATGMGGMAFEQIAKQGKFVCVMDFALPELGNLLAGSVINGGEDRMLSAGMANIPQIIAPGCIDLIDFAGWQEIPKKYSDRPFHEHNRLIKSSALNTEERRETAREINFRLKKSEAPVHVILPMRGIEEWDKIEGPAHDPDGLNAFMSEMKNIIEEPISVTEIDNHINDEEFSLTVMKIFDNWVEQGIVLNT